MIIGIGVGINRQRYMGSFSGAYQSRVTADGAIVESISCVGDASSLLQSASLLLIPSGYKGGKLYSEIPTNGNGDLTWTRGGDAFRTNASGLIQRVPWNLVQYSEDFTNAVWGKTNVTVSGNTTIAPNGTTTADTLTTTATTGRHLLLYGDHSATTITASIYVKKNTHNFFQIFTGWAGVAYANYDINNGVVGDVGSGTVASITNVGNGWYRCSFTSPAASASTIRWNLVTSSTAVYNESWTANGTESVYIWGAQLVEGTTAQTYLPTTDRLGFPRLDYTYGSCPALLLEPQRTNSILRSQDFDNASWVKTRSSVTANTITSPDGTSNADTFEGNGVSGSRFLSVTSAFATTSGVSYTISIFAKKNTNNFLQIDVSGGAFGSDAYGNFDLNSGVVGSIGSGVNATITNVGNGWYRCTITKSASTTSTAPLYLALITASNSPTFETNTLSTSVYLYGAQVEQGAYPTTYIPTTSATATRVADSFDRNNIFTNGLITSSGGTWFVEFKGNNPKIRDGFMKYGLTDVASSNGFYFNQPSGVSQRLTLNYYLGGSATTSVFVTTTDNVKLAIKWNGSTADIFQNGVKVVSNITFTFTQMQILNCSGVGITTFIQQMALFPSPLSDTDCTTLTT